MPNFSTQLAVAVSESFVATQRKMATLLGGEGRRFGKVFAFRTGLSSSGLNGCLVMEPANRGDLEAALHWVSYGSVAWRVWLRQDLVEELGEKLGETPLAFGLVRDAAPYPGMALHPLPEPATPRADLLVTTVTDEAALAEYRAASLGWNVPPEMAARLYNTRLLEDRSVRLVAVRADEKVAGGAMAIRFGDVCSLTMVGAAMAARRRGVGSAASWAAVAAARGWGCSTVALQASAEGLPMYLGMGFVEVVSYAVFRPAVTT